MSEDQSLGSGTTTFDMKGAQDYLVAHNVPCKSRVAFYRLIRTHKIKFTDLIPNSKYSKRRFAKRDLDKFLEKIGINPITESA